MVRVAMMSAPQLTKTLYVSREMLQANKVADQPTRGQMTDIKV